jgi:hypothetical protein
MLRRIPKDLFRTQPGSGLNKQAELVLVIEGGIGRDMPFVRG